MTEMGETLSGFNNSRTPTQGSLCLATLGWRTQSPWECQTLRYLARSAVLVMLLFAMEAGWAKGPYEIRRLSEKEILQTYTNLLWDAVHHADQFWHDWPDHPEAGMWGTGRSDQMNEGVRAISEMVFTSGVLAKYSAAPGSSDRNELVRKATAAMRYVVASHLSGSQKCTDGKPWGGSWQSAMWTGTMAF